MALEDFLKTDKKEGGSGLMPKLNMGACGCFVILIIGVLAIFPAMAGVFSGENTRSGDGDEGPGIGGPVVIAPGDCSEAAQRSNVTFEQTNDRQGMLAGGVIINKDGEKVTVDGRVCQLINTLAENGFSLRISSIVGHHSQYEAGSTNESRHWTGHAFDIGNEDICGSLEPWIVQNLSGTALMPRQVIGPIRCSQWAVNRGQQSPGFYVEGHEDHIHIGF